MWKISYLGRLLQCADGVINTNAPTSPAEAAMTRKAGLKLSVVAIIRLNKLGPTTAPRKLENTVPPVATAT